jgi:hypothetical protein
VRRDTFHNGKSADLSDSCCKPGLAGFIMPGINDTDIIINRWNLSIFDLIKKISITNEFKSIIY